MRVGRALEVGLVKRILDRRDFAVEKFAEHGTDTVGIAGPAEDHGFHAPAIHKQNFGRQLQVVAERFRDIEVVEIFALESSEFRGSIPVAAERTVESVAAAAAEFGVGSGAFFDSLIEDDAAEGGLHRSAAGAANVQIEHGIVSGTISGVVEFRGHLQRRVMGVEDGASPMGK